MKSVKINISLPNRPHKCFSHFFIKLTKLSLKSEALKRNFNHLSNKKLHTLHPFSCLGWTEVSFVIRRWVWRSCPQVSSYCPCYRSKSWNLYTGCWFPASAFFCIALLTSLSLHLWPRLWLYRRLRSGNTSPQRLHGYPVWESWCSFRLFCQTNVSPHVSHQNGLSPVCTRLWRFRLDRWVKVLLHLSHQYGFSPVWLRRWVFRAPRYAKVLSHRSQLYGFSPVCKRWWPLREPDSVNRLPHSSQT